MTAPFRFDPSVLRQPFYASPRPVLVRQEAEAPSLPPRRTKIWELANTLHCSIIGTCLSTAELRRILGKAGTSEAGDTDHALHGKGVTLAGQAGGAAKLIQKALDERHRLTIRRFDQATTGDEVRTLWRAARQQGDIPSAYWAVLTHPATSNQLVRDVFGEIHMLSHLVGAANRADIRRLAELEAEKDALEDKVARQQARLHEAIVSRDRRIRELGDLLADRLSDRPETASTESDHAALADLVADLRRRLAAEQGRRETIEQRLLAERTASAEERAARVATERHAQCLADEIAALETGLTLPDDPLAEPALRAQCVLYVGGRPSAISQMRAIGQRRGVELLHHDGGVDERTGLLAGLVSRADLVLFPVDCISHDAALTVKRLCRQAGKTYVPLRGGGIASFLAALSH